VPVARPFRHLATYVQGSGEKGRFAASAVSAGLDFETNSCCAGGTLLFISGETGFQKCHWFLGAFALLRDKDNFLIVASSDDASNYLSGASA
jgi:hypothetical protein